MYKIAGKKRMSIWRRPKFPPYIHERDSTVIHHFLQYPKDRFMSQDQLLRGSPGIDRNSPDDDRHIHCLRKRNGVGNVCPVSSGCESQCQENLGVRKRFSSMTSMEISFKFAPGPGPLLLAVTRLYRRMTLDLIETKNRLLEPIQ